MKNFFLSLAAAPFLFTPYVLALRHSRIERSRINHFSRLFLADQFSSYQT
jgi:hypothetical protein